MVVKPILSTSEMLHVVEGLTVAYASDVFSIAASFENPADTDAEDDELNLGIVFPTLELTT